jgi:hypothetical protein
MQQSGEQVDIRGPGDQLAFAPGGGGGGPARPPLPLIYRSRPLLTTGQPHFILCSLPPSCYCPVLSCPVLSCPVLFCPLLLTCRIFFSFALTICDLLFPALCKRVPSYSQEIDISRLVRSNPVQPLSFLSLSSLLQVNTII